MPAPRDEIGIGAFQLAGIYAGQARGERRAFAASRNHVPRGKIGPEPGVAAGSYRRVFTRLGRTI